MEVKTDEEKCNTFKHMLEDLNFYNEDHETAQADQKKDEKKMVVMMTTMLIMMIKVIFFHPSYVSWIWGLVYWGKKANQKDKLT